MTEYEKMEKGLLYDPLDEAIMKEQQVYQDRLWAFNQLKPADFAGKEAFLKENFAECGEGCYIEIPFHANWGGHHVHFGSYIYANFNLTLVDDGHIYVGDHVMIGPNVTIATANHPLEPEPRAKGWQINSDVRIGENVWLGAGVIIVPGVTIGKNTVIGAGSIVTKDIPDNVLAVGNPCRVIREIGTDSNSKKTHREDVMFDILTIGEMLIDLTQTGVSDAGIPVYTAFPGGAPANVAVAAAKLGAKGAYYRAGELTGLCEGVKVKVADTNGAGDTFFGAFLSGMARLGKYKSAELTQDEIKELVGFANKAASIKTSRSGAIPAMPTLDEVME